MCLLRGTDWVFIYNFTFCPHSVFMCSVWISEQTAIISLHSINWLVLITVTQCVYCAVLAGSLNVIKVSYNADKGNMSLRLIKHNNITAVKPSGYYMYHKVWHPKILRSAHTMRFVWIAEQTAIISLYSINWLVFITVTECVYCAVRTRSLYIMLRSAHTLHLCVSYESQNKQRLFPYTALTDWFL